MILRPVAPPVEYGITKRLARAGNAAIAFLRSLGTNAHVWLPGANGVSVASLPSNNYLLSDGSTGYSTVDGVDGLVKDAMDPVTGINLTQATTANKPLVRRGMLKLLNSATPATQSVTCIAAPYTLALYGTGNVVLSGTGAGTLTGTGASDLVVLNFTPTAGSVTFTKAGTVSSFGLFKGTWTAAQILAEGGIPTTTATAASSPTSGKYWWSFDGNDSLAAGSVPFQFSDDFCLHFSAQISAASGNQTIYAATNVAGDRAPWVRFEPTGKVVFQCFQAAGTLTAEVQSTATYVGQAIIIRCRKVGSTITLWINGVQVASASTAALTSMGTITTALFGQFVSGTLYYTGALGCSVSVTGTQTDADGLTIDRLLASTFPGAPVF